MDETLCKILGKWSSVRRSQENQEVRRISFWATLFSIFTQMSHPSTGILGIERTPYKRTCGSHIGRRTLSHKVNIGSYYADFERRKHDLHKKV